MGAEKAHHNATFRDATPKWPATPPKNDRFGGFFTCAIFFNAHAELFENPRSQTESMSLHAVYRTTTGFSISLVSISDKNSYYPLKKKKEKLGKGGRPPPSKWRTLPITILPNFCRI